METCFCLQYIVSMITVARLQQCLLGIAVLTIVTELYRVLLHHKASREVLCVNIAAGRQVWWTQQGTWSGKSIYPHPKEVVFTQKLLKIFDLLESVCSWDGEQTTRTMRSSYPFHFSAIDLALVGHQSRKWYTPNIVNILVYYSIIYS